MITPQACPGQPPSWREELADSITDPVELLETLNLDPSLAADARRAARHFPLRVPRGFVDRMVKGDIDDPLLRQILPLRLELEEHPEYGPDPVGDLPARQARGVLKKYPGRVLLIASGACAINCRYCFRREFPYGEFGTAAKSWTPAIDYLRQQTETDEVLLSG
ncbi:MAG: EF-P beta-lysylation protein EpmB, partial [Gammaproteobacteria bacterium]